MGIMDLLHGMKRGARKEVESVKREVFKSRSMIEAELKVEFDRLEENYRLDIERQLQIRQDENSSPKARKRAEGKIELSLGALYLIKIAREDLRDAQTSAQLAGDMRDLGKGLHIINRLYTAGPDVKTDYLNKQVKTMNALAEKASSKKDVAKAINENSMESMPDGWQKAVNQVFTQDMSVDEFIKSCGSYDSPYADLGSAKYNNEKHHSNLDDLDRYEPADKSVDASAERIYASAEDLEQYEKMKRDMGGM